MVHTQGETNFHVWALSNNGTWNLLRCMRRKYLEEPIVTGAAAGTKVRYPARLQVDLPIHRVLKDPARTIG